MGGNGGRQWGVLWNIEEIIPLGGGSEVSEEALPL